MKHCQIVELYGVSEKAVLQKADGETEQVMYLVLELAAGGDLFDYLKHCGPFTEEFARFYFLQLIDVLEYIHSIGVTHRDLKTENLLLDGQFNLKVSDFGLSTVLSGHDHSGYLHDVLGTPGYMPPELYLQNPTYNGELVDVFSAGVILFVMLTASIPFYNAVLDDYYYYHFCVNTHEKFWLKHNKTQNGHFSEGTITLLTSLLSFSPAQRPSVSEIKSHPWLLGPIPSQTQIIKEFSRRKEIIQGVKLKYKMEDLAAMDPVQVLVPHSQVVTEIPHNNPITNNIPVHKGVECIFGGHQIRPIQ